MCVASFLSPLWTIRDCLCNGHKLLRQTLEIDFCLRRDLRKKKMNRRNGETAPIAHTGENEKKIKKAERKNSIPSEYLCVTAAERSSSSGRESRAGYFSALVAVIALESARKKRQARTVATDPYCGARRRAASCAHVRSSNRCPLGVSGLKLLRKW